MYWNLNNDTGGILKAKLRRIIKDDKFLKVLFEVIDVTDVGLPLGYYTSQWLANWFLQDLDHYIKEDLRAPYYVRYMDDMVVFSSNKKELHRMRIAVAKYLKEKLGLELKDTWQVFRMDYVKDGRHYGRPLDFMGFRFYCDKTTLRKSIMLNACQKARRIYLKHKLTTYEARQMLSYIGWLDATDTYAMYLKRIKPYVVVKRLKRKIGAHDRKEKRNVEQSRILRKAECGRRDILTDLHLCAA